MRFSTHVDKNKKKNKNKTTQQCNRYSTSTRLLFRIGEWPSAWKEHWIFPLHKKRNTHDTDNYRGIHLTAQVSKVAERVIAFLIRPHLEKCDAFGENQFAYRKARGSRDAIAHLVLTWMLGLSARHKFGLYCADVSGAFDKVWFARMKKNLKPLDFRIS